jgi:molybdate transport system regulatory protein
MSKTPPNLPILRFRIVLENGQWLGPGKADLLDAIVATGSIAAAGRSMDMSYKRAWQLVDNLNRMFAVPLVTTSKGGGHGGGAKLTPAGIKVLAIYRSVQDKSKKTLGAELRALRQLLH